MTWLAEFTRRRLPALVAGLVLATVACAAPAGTNAPASARPAAAVSNALPAWMELSALATNAAEWADMAQTWRRGPDAEASPTEDFLAPIENYESGRPRAILHAAKAAIGKAGLIWSWKVSVDLLSPTGAPDGRVEAESCLYDRTSRRGYCPTAVSLVRTNAIITGTGLYWTMTTQHMQILSNPVVRLRQGVRLPGVTSK